MPSPEELKEAIATYEKLIAAYTRARDRLTERRRSIRDRALVEVDELLEGNVNTIEVLQRAVEITREHLKTVQREKGAKQGQ